MITVTFDYPPGTLSPNSRAHWGTKAKYTKAYRRDSAYALIAASKPIDLYKLRAYKRLSLGYVFHPADKRPRDLDNAIASCKALQDGIRDVLDIDDSQFQCTYEFGPIVKGGAVTVTIRGAT